MGQRRKEMSAVPSRHIQLPGDAVALSAAMVDKLLRKGSGDAALLYLYLLRHDGFYDPEEACRTLQWDRTRLDGALLHLNEIGVQTGESQPSFTAPVPKKEDAPEYTREDLAQAISDQSSDFPALLEEVERKFGAKLPDRDIRTLLELFDHLGLPAEVLLLLINWQCEEYAEKYGEGRHPPMSHVRTAAYRWKKAGIDTLEAADAYLKKRNYYRSQEGTMLAALDIRGRKALESERKFLNQWLDWGFPPETVAMAYERTMMNTGERKWSYCNGILKRWHQAGLHTPEEVRQAEAPRRTARQGSGKSVGPAPAKPLTAKQQEAQAQALEENQRQLNRLLEETAWLENHKP
ncbi:MAG: DnaD domain protein [Clostridiales bacterium]|nr:DnaD domain protein [Clostridiales bacterium]